MLPIDVCIYVTVLFYVFHCEFLPKRHALHLMEFDLHTIKVYLLTYLLIYIRICFD